MRDFKEKVINIIQSKTNEAPEVIEDTYKTIESRVENVEIVLNVLTSVWGTLKEETKTDLAIGIAGRFNLGRFLVLMNELSKEYKKE